MAVMCVGNCIAITTTNYWIMIVARFLSGLPHGVFLVAAANALPRLAPKHKQIQSTIMLFYALTGAYLLGVPVATYLAQLISWRMMFAAIAGWSIFVIYFIYTWFPEQEKNESEIYCIRFLPLKQKITAIFMLLVLFGNAGIFCWYTYINQIMVETAGFKFYAMAGIMMIAGLAMVIGKTSSEKLSAFVKPLYLLAIMLGLMFVASLLLIFLSESPYAALILLFIGIFGFSGIVLPEQKLGEENSQTEEISQSAFYLMTLSAGNALGAMVGALPMIWGYSVEFSAVPAVIILATALGLVYYFWSKTAATSDKNS